MAKIKKNILSLRKSKMFYSNFEHFSELEFGICQNKLLKTLEIKNIPETSANISNPTRSKAKPTY